MHDIKDLVRQVRSLPGPLPIGRVALQRANELAGPIALTSEEESAFLEAWSGNSEPLLTPYAKRTVSCLTEASEILGNMATACADGAQHVRDFGATEENARDAGEIHSRVRGLQNFVDGGSEYGEYITSLAPKPLRSPIPQKDMRLQPTDLRDPVQKRVDIDGAQFGGKTVRAVVLQEIRRVLSKQYAMLLRYTDPTSGDEHETLWVTSGTLGVWVKIGDSLDDEMATVTISDV